MKKVLLIVIIICTFLHSSFSQIIVEYRENGKLIPEEGFYVSNTDYPRINLPEFDFSELREKSLKASPNEPFQFGKEFDLNLSLEDGKWYDFHEGKIWKLRISSKNAFSLNLVFSKLHLSEGARMYIYNDDRDMMMGPFDHNNVHTAQGDFITDLIKGSSITIELYEPNENPVSHVIISKVIHGFVNTFSSGFGQSAPCNIDIDCPIGQPFELESNSVSRLLVANGTSFCSGALVNTTCTDFNPFLLTADHCLAGNPGAYVFRFQYRSPIPRCDGQGGGANSFVNIFYNGAQIRARNEDTDFGLLEMNTRPNHGNVSFLGWTRNTRDISNTAGIHHPRGDMMKISIDNDSPQLVSWGIGPLNYWRAEFNIGSVEFGSSGSPLLDNHRRMIGQLSGDQNNSCQNTPNNVCFCNQRIGEYGRFDISWGRDSIGNFLQGRNVENSLATWLDPNNTNAMTTNTIPIPTISGPDNFCSTSPYSLQNPPTGSTVSWSVSPTNLFSGATSGTGATVNLSPASSSVSGEATLTFSLTTDCGVVNVEKSIWIGEAAVNWIEFSNSANEFEQWCSSHDGNYFNIYYQMSPDNAQWEARLLHWPSLTVAYTSSQVYTGSGPHQLYHIPPFPTLDNGYYVFQMRNINGCNAYDWVSYYEIEYVDCTEYDEDPFRIYPNPTTDYVTVSKISNQKLGEEIQRDQTSFEVSLFDVVGQEIIHRAAATDEATLDLSKLKKGRYYIHIYYKEAIIRKQIKVE